MDKFLEDASKDEMVEDIFNLTKINSNGVPTDERDDVEIENGVDTEMPRPLQSLPSVSRMGKNFEGSIGGGKKKKSEVAERLRKQKRAEEKKLSREISIGRMSDPAHMIREMDVVKYICMRERGLAQLRIVARKLRESSFRLVAERRGVSRPLDGFASLVQKIRGEQELLRTTISNMQLASAAVVEAVQNWRGGIIREREAAATNATKEALTFRWKGQNYLLKMMKDTRFLSARRSRSRSISGEGRELQKQFIDGEDRRDPVPLWLGFEPRDSPLLMPPEGMDVASMLVADMEAREKKRKEDEQAQIMLRAELLRRKHLGLGTPDNEQLSNLGGTIEKIVEGDGDEENDEMGEQNNENSPGMGPATVGEQSSSLPAWKQRRIRRRVSFHVRWCR